MILFQAFSVCSDFNRKGARSMAILDTIDVVVDLGEDPQGRGALLLESLLVYDEGLTVRYHIRLDRTLLDPALRAVLIDFVALKQATLTYDPPDHMFPQERLDAERADAIVRGKSAMKTSVKRAWFVRNVRLLEAIERFDAFVYLLPDCAPVCAGWLAQLVDAGRGGQWPWLGYPRRLRVGETFCLCGWSSLGWFDGERLRTLPLRRTLLERWPNPWAEIGNFAEQPGGPGFCLRGLWLSGFDVPMDYWLFALFAQAHFSDNPHAWAQWLDTSDSGLVVVDQPDEGDNLCLAPNNMGSAVLVHEYASRELRKGLLRTHALRQAKNRLIAMGAADFISRCALPLSGPRDQLADLQRGLSLDALHDRFSGQRCVIMGNGPSLRGTDWSLLKGEWTIGLNRIYLGYEAMGFQPTFLCITNPNVIEQFAPEIDRLESVKFLRYSTRHCLQNHWNAHFIESRKDRDFYTDLRWQIWNEGCTVTYCALQVAFFLGFQQVILIGVDHHFPHAGEPHQLVTADRADVNHFHPDYFGAGVQWQYPDLECSERFYVIARNFFEKTGREIWDATIEGKLNVFLKGYLSDFLENS
jgi:hypothetical protein